MNHFIRHLVNWSQVRTHSTRRVLSRPSRLCLESLEDRCLLNASLEHGVLHVHGDNNDNTIDVSLNETGDTVEVTIDEGDAQEFELTSVHKIEILSSDGDDTVTVDPDITVPTDIHSGHGDDVVDGGSGPNTILGGLGDDSLTGGDDSDHIRGRLGNDTVDGGGGDDMVHGGRGDDSVLGGDGTDLIRAAHGHDTVDAGDGDDTVVCAGDKNNAIEPGTADDTMHGCGANQNPPEAQPSFAVTKLVADQASAGAAHTDANLVNAWGLAFAGSGPFWVNANGTGVSTLYDGSGNSLPGAVTIPKPGGASGASTPTGIVSNSSSDFAVTGGTAIFLFATEDGTIAGWASGSTAEIKVNNSATGAVYKGLAIGTSGTNNFLYAANFSGGKIDVFDKNFAAATLAGNFTDPNIPSGFAPFNIQNIGGKLYVAYAKQDAAKTDDVAGSGNGLVSVFNSDGTLVKTLVTHGQLNSPWGLALAPASFGDFSGDLLVGNFGDGRINAFNIDTGSFQGRLVDNNRSPIVVAGLWGLSFGNGGQAGAASDLFFAAGPSDEEHGLFGKITVNP